MMALRKATKDRKAMRLAAMLRTSMTAVEAPWAAASRTLASVPFSILISSMVVLKVEKKIKLIIFIL
jgi:hypothetical protein